MKNAARQGTQRSDPRESSEDEFSDLVIPHDFVVSSEAMYPFLNRHGQDLLVAHDDDSNSSSSSPHTALSIDFTGETSHEFLNVETNTQIFVTDGNLNYIIDTSSFLANTIDTIIKHGWFVSFIVPPEHSQSTVLIDVIQIAEKLGISCEELFSSEEPTFHELKKHSEDKDDEGDSEQHFGGSGCPTSFSASSNIPASSDQKEKAGSATTSGATTYSLAFVIGAISIIGDTSGYSCNVYNNPIVDFFKNSLLELTDYYLMS